MPTPAVLGRSTRKNLVSALLAVPLGLFSAPGLASGPSLTLIQPADGFQYSYASSVADNGTVAGRNDQSTTTSTQTDTPSFVWTEAGGREDFLPPSSWRGGYPILTPDARYMAVSGSWTVYNSDNGNYTSGSYAYRRNSDGSYTSLPGRGGSSYHTPTGISGDGQRIIGYDGTNGINNSWLWDHGVTTSINIPGQPDVYTANGISRDGSTIVGNKGFTSSRGFVRRANGSYELLSNITQSVQTYAYAVNADGTIIVGSNGGLPVVWRNMVPSLLDFTTAFALGGGRATGISNDGNVIVGSVSGSQTLPAQGFVWTPTTGIMTGADFARSIGLEIPMTWVFNQLHVSGNGMFICGVVSATDLSVQSRAFRLQIPSPAAIYLFAGVLALPRRKR